tara:strand:- start:246 stop:347 length:102 start_codon:yes stop_codon:yes gene_type:complete
VVVVVVEAGGGGTIPEIEDKAKAITVVKLLICS